MLPVHRPGDKHAPGRPAPATPAGIRAAVAGAVALSTLLMLAPSAVGDGAPAKGSELFDPGRVWTIHLGFTPERWARMEPKGGTNLFDPSAFGLGMFLAPAVMRDGDANKDGKLSEAEFRGLAGRWFDAWDDGRGGVLEAKQVRAGLKQLLKPPDADEPVGTPPGMSLQAKEGRRNGLSGMMGLDFEYVRADLDFEGQALPDAAVRYKGNGTFLESRGSLKRSFKIDLDKHAKGRRLAGTATLNLHNNVADAGMMHEAIAYRLYRDFDVPAPRTSYARVFVTVPGIHDRKYFGVYSLVENVDEEFVADRGLGAGGAILKPSTPDLFADLGDDWKNYRQAYDPKTDLTDDQKRRVIAFCRLVTGASDEEFAARLGEFVDLDEFARFLAASVWVGDLDSILTTGQNFHLFLRPADGRFLFIPWDKDHTFGSWIGGDYDGRARHSIREPWEGRKRFLQRAFKVEAFRSRYLGAMARLAEELARPERIEEQVKSLAAALRPAVAEESPEKLLKFEAVAAGQPLVGGFLGFGKPTPTMLMFAKDRAASVRDQIAGKDEGVVLGRPKPGDKGPPPFEEMVEPALVKALDADRDGKLGRAEFAAGFDKWFAAWAEGRDGGLDEETLRKGLNRALPFPSPFFGPPGPKDSGTPAKPAAGS